jgi:membrane associated rhomboid family serine protease
VFKEIFSSTIIPATLVAILILVVLGEFVFDIDLVQFGIFPRKLSGLLGVLTYPFIHSDWKHLFNNSTALFILGTMLYYFYREVASKSLLWVYVISGVWLWIGGRANFHIGASGIVYALFGFLFVSGLLRKHLKLMALSMLVIFLYGSLVWGIFPVDQSISYEGHLFGLLAGVVVAFVYRKQGPQRPKYSWDLVDEEEIPEWYPDPERERRRQAERQLEEQRRKKQSSGINIRYIFKSNDREKNRD